MTMRGAVMRLVLSYLYKGSSHELSRMGQHLYHLYPLPILYSWAPSICSMIYLCNPGWPQTQHLHASTFSMMG